MGSVNIHFTAELAPYVRSLPALSTLFRQGQPGSSLIIILTGKIQLYDETDRQKHPVSLLGEGEILGEKVLYQSLPFRRMFTAITETPCQIIEVDFDHLPLLRERVPKLQELIIGVLSRRLEQCNHLVQILQIPEEVERLRQYLLHLRTTLGLDNGPISVTEVSHTLNLSPTVTERVLEIYRKRGVLDRKTAGYALINPVLLLKREPQ